LRVESDSGPEFNRRSLHREIEKFAGQSNAYDCKGLTVQSEVLAKDFWI